MQHPKKKQRDNQAKILAELPKEKREETARLFRFINASYVYHKQADALNSTETDFQEWLHGLPKEDLNNMTFIAFGSSKNSVSFNRYLLEKNDIGMDEWLKEHLSEDDYNEYCKLIEARRNLD